MKSFGNGIKYKLSVIILSYALDDDIYNLNKQAIESLLASETWPSGRLQILLIESNKENPYQYPYPNVDVLIPNEKFGFHRFFNIGIEHTDGEYLAFCNNDIIFHKKWFSAIREVADNRQRFLCFSPIDDSGNYPKMSPEALPRDKAYYRGWEHQKHFAPWCFVWKRKAFDITGPFDETIDFYGADCDEQNMMSRNALWSVVCTKSVVNHLAGQTAVVKQSGKDDKYRITDYDKYPLTEFEKKHNYPLWIYDDYRFYEGYQKLKKKWGLDNTTKWLQRKITQYPILNFRPLTRLLFTKRMNHIFCRLRGIKP